MTRREMSATRTRTFFPARRPGRGRQRLSPLRPTLVCVTAHGARHTAHSAQTRAPRPARQALAPRPLPFFSLERSPSAAMSSASGPAGAGAQRRAQAAALPSSTLGTCSSQLPCVIRARQRWALSGRRRCSRRGATRRGRSSRRRCRRGGVARAVAVGSPSPSLSDRLFFAPRAAQHGALPPGRDRRVRGDVYLHLLDHRLRRLYAGARAGPAPRPCAPRCRSARLLPRPPSYPLFSPHPPTVSRRTAAFRRRGSCKCR